MGAPVSLLINGERYEVDVLERSGRSVRFALAGREYLVELEESAPQKTEVKRAAPAADLRSAAGRTPAGAKSGQVVSALPGVVVDILVKTGEKVAAGAVLLRIEAMKMQNSIFAPISGTVSTIHVQPGMEVGDGQLLVDIREESA